MGLADRLRSGLAKSREALNQIFYMGGDVDEQFWENLEDTLVMGDIGPELAMSVTDDLRELAAKKGLRTANQLREALAKRLAEAFPTSERDPFDDTPSCVLFVGINGAGKTTTVGKLAAAAKGKGKSVLIGGADTFRAAADREQLQVSGKRADVRVVTRERGADPASVCYDVVETAEREGTGLMLIDTAGRLHTSPELMRELAKYRERHAQAREHARADCRSRRRRDHWPERPRAGEGVQRRARSRWPHRDEARRHLEGRYRGLDCESARPADLAHRCGRGHR